MASNHTMKFISGLIFGGLAGVAAAMLYAPQSGDETRQMLRNTAMDAQVRTRETLRQAQDQVQHKVDEVQQRVSSVAAEARDKASRLTDLGQDVAREQKEALQTGMSQGEDIIRD